ncbi:hypothetical protein MGYG_08882 [Nannizzia gypsea CBS 118893]|uniref:Uncharacterized protein n=1 Tax=Arthroderma gypseum (strain ATCC MYA-4604 / CBS 118893) TaxID=535722 RepID=E5R371_ARTGP|nr:hypothetical protein MGYG_08882 [Nannizzia gypsea CBS 118893]EFQ97100.1 hypothetical protein MGYG_08882 [Nannizzia gypsea CBS 118893]
MRQVKFSIRSWFGNWVLVRLYNFHICVANGSFFCSSSVVSSAVPSLQSENTDSRRNPPASDVVRQLPLQLAGGRMGGRRGPKWRRPSGGASLSLPCAKPLLSTGSGRCRHFTTQRKRSSRWVIAQEFRLVGRRRAGRAEDRNSGCPGAASESAGGGWKDGGTEEVPAGPWAKGPGLVYLASLRGQTLNWVSSVPVSLALMLILRSFGLSGWSGGSGLAGLVRL